MDEIELACRYDARDTVEVRRDADGDVWVELTRGPVYLDRAAQERLYAWLGEALGIGSSSQHEGQVSDGG